MRRNSKRAKALDPMQKLNMEIDQYNNQSPRSTLNSLKTSPKNLFVNQTKLSIRKGMKRMSSRLTDRAMDVGDSTGQQSHRSIDREEELTLGFQHTTQKAKIDLSSVIKKRKDGPPYLTGLAGIATNE